jgi:hypothetical protein
VLRISPRGNVILEDTDTSKLGSRWIQDTRSLRAGRTLYVGKWYLEIQEAVQEAEEATTTTATATTALIEHSHPTLHPPQTVTTPCEPSPRFCKAYKTPVQSIPAAIYATECEQCKALDHACNGETPCRECSETNQGYCCYVDTTGTTMLRYPASPGARCDDGETCDNCQIFRLQCNGASNIPCLNCLDKHRAFCTTVHHDATVKTILCSAFRLVENLGNSRSRIIVPRTVFKDNPNEVWPPWPREGTSPTTADRLRKRFADDGEHKVMSHDELMAWYRSGQSDLPKRSGR